jgi:hypothetical protein
MPKNFKHWDFSKNDKKFPGRNEKKKLSTLTISLGRLKFQKNCQKIQNCFFGGAFLEKNSPKSVQQFLTLNMLGYRV